MANYMNDWLSGWPHWLRWILLLPAMAIWVFAFLRTGSYFFMIISVDPNGFAARIVLELLTGFLLVYVAHRMAPKGKSIVSIIMLVATLIIGAFALTVKMGVVQAWGAAAQVAGASIAVYYQRLQSNKLT